jgi:hypothetical protein
LTDQNAFQASEHDFLDDTVVLGFRNRFSDEYLILEALESAGFRSGARFHDSKAAKPPVTPPLFSVPLFNVAKGG